MILRYGEAQFKLAHEIVQLLERAVKELIYLHTYGTFILHLCFTCRQTQVMYLPVFLAALNFAPVSCTCILFTDTF